MPVMGYNFVVALIDTSSPLNQVVSVASALSSVVLGGGFTECTGLEMSLDVHDYEEGGQNGFVHRFATRVKWNNLTLKKGVGFGTGLWDWHYGYAEGKGTRRDGLIILLDDLHLPNNIWQFSRGLPVRYSGPSMNAQQSEVAIESIEIAHEGIVQVSAFGFAPGTLRAVAGLS